MSWGTYNARFEDNPQVHKKLMKNQLCCSYCPPNQNENRKKNCKYDSKSWKDKTKKKRQWH